MSPKKSVPQDPDAALNAFLTALLKDRRPLTIATYTRDLRAFATWFEQTNGYTLVPQTLTAIDVAQYRDWLSTRKASAATVNRKLAALRAYASWARNAGLTTDNPAAGVKGIKKQKATPKWLDKLEQAALLREVEKAKNNGTDLQKLRGLRDRALIYTLLYAGLRVAEAIAVEWDDVELGDRSGTLVVRHGKGNKERAVPLNAKVRDALRDWKDQRPKEVKSQRVFISLGVAGEPIKARVVQRMLAEYGRRAKLDDLTPHVLRHTCAKNLVNTGALLDRVATILGHESLDTTKLYTAASQAELQAAVDRAG